MGEIVNLRRVRKAKARQEEAAQAEANRARTGTTKRERSLVAEEKHRAARVLDGARLEPKPD